MHEKEQARQAKKQQDDAIRKQMRSQIMHEKIKEGYGGFQLYDVVRDELKKRLEEVANKEKTRSK